jgi:hypothetical protein
MENIGKPKYGLIDNKTFGFKIVTGIVSGIRYTESDPIYELSYKNNKWWTNKISDSYVELIENHLNIKSLSQIEFAHNIKFVTHAK